MTEAIHSLSDPSIFNENPIPLRRITLSTVGVVHGIRKLGRECPQIQLALSLHAPNDTVREAIVPTTKAFSIPKIMAAVDEYQQAAGKSVMIEYIMIANVNSSSTCAHELGSLLQGRKCMVNLIPYNTTEAGDRYGFKAPLDVDIEAFAKILYTYRDHKGKSLRCAIRWSSRRGQEIDAACGQLALKNVCASGNNKKDSGDIEDLGKAKHPTKTSRTSFSGMGNNNGASARSKPNGGSDESTSSRCIQVCAMAAGILVLGGILVLRRKRT